MKTKLLLTFAHSELCSFTSKIFSCLKFRGVIVAFHVVSFCLLPFAFSYSQAPYGFNYQAVARDGIGQILKNEVLTIKIGIVSESASGDLQWEETHSVTTNDFGIFTIEVGGGVRTGGAASEFDDIDWGVFSHFLNVQVNQTGSYVDMGTTQLLSVPYAINASSVSSLKNLSIMEKTGHVADSALFEVKNIDGNTVFAVYNEGVRVYVDDDAAKGPKGGFAVGGFSSSKGITGEYFRVTPDSVRVYVDTLSSKGPKGGFAVGGFSSSKGITNEYLRVTPDSVRVYIDETIAKGLKGGFAVGGFSPGKAGSANMMHLTPDNYFIGHQSGSSITTGLYNSFFGYQSGLLNDVGNRNVFLGYNTGYSNTEGNYNTFIGSNTGYSNTAGLSNVFIGDSSGYDNTIGSYNVFMGNLSGVQNDSGYYNVFIGDSAGYSNVEGNQNIFLGVGSGFLNKSGGHNVFLGVESGRNNTEGTANVILGDFAGHLNDTGNYNIFIGASSGYSNIGGKSNVFLGTAAGHDNDTGNYNIMIGNWSGARNTSGKSNVFMGYAAGYSNTTADWNVNIGNLAGYSNEDGEKNVFLGAESGYTNTSGYKNVFIGNLSGFANIDGIRSVYVGASSGQRSTDADYNAFFGSYTGYYNTTGTRNTFIGNEAGYSNTTGGYNVYVGRLAGYTNSTGEYNVFIGNEAGRYATGSNKLFIENSSATSTTALIYGDFDSDHLRLNANVGIGYSPYSMYSLVVKGGSTNSLRVYEDIGQPYGLYLSGDAYATGNWWIPSDINFKTNVQTYIGALDKVLKTRGVTFEFINDEKSEIKYPDGKQIGVVAQEIKDLFPELVKKDSEGKLAVAYSGFTPVLIEAIKEQQKMIEELQKRIATLEEGNK